MKTASNYTLAVFLWQSKVRLCHTPRVTRARVRQYQVVCDAKTTCL